MLFADLALSQRLERQEAIGGARFIEARARLSPERHPEWIDVNGVYAMFDGPDSPITQTFGLGLYADPDLDKLEAFFHKRDAPVNHEVSPLAGIPLADTLAQRGYRPIEFTSVMYQPIVPHAPTAATVTTRLLHPGEEDLWCRVSAEGWTAEHPEYTEFLVEMGQVIASTEGVLAFFAHLDGKPIAAAVLRIHEGVALFAGASTIVGARNQGAQQALLDARMQYAAAHRCDLAMMCAAPGTASQRNAQRQGFQIAYTRTKWQLAAGLLPIAHAQPRIS
jgi:hypothetical protein